MRLMAITVGHADLPDEEFTAQSLDYVVLVRSLVQIHLTLNFDYLLKETVFQRRLRLKLTDLLFANLHYVDCLDTSPARWSELLVKGPGWLVCYKCSHLL